MVEDQYSPEKSPKEIAANEDTVKANDHTALTSNDQSSNVQSSNKKKRK